MNVMSDCSAASSAQYVDGARDGPGYTLLPSSVMIGILRRNAAYWTCTLAVLLVWAGWIAWTRSFEQVASHWLKGLVMTVGSFIAGLTAMGGGAVAYPVFTKALHVDAAEACVFGLLIQSVGMTMASVVILTRRRDIDLCAVATLSAVAASSHGFALLMPAYPAVFNRLLFTAVIAALGATLLRLPPRMRHAERHRREITLDGSATGRALVAAAVVGGAIASKLGTGLDIAVFTVLALGLRYDLSRATAFSVVMMAVHSTFGAVLHGLVLRDVGEVVHWWLAAVPVVIFGAPLGAWVCLRMRDGQGTVALLVLIAAEIASTAWLVPKTAANVAYFSALLLAGLAATHWLYRLGQAPQDSPDPVHSPDPLGPVRE